MRAGGYNLSLPWFVQGGGQTRGMVLKGQLALPVSTSQIKAQVKSNVNVNLRITPGIHTFYYTKYWRWERPGNDVHIQIQCT